jgi:hypothetical protein
LPLQLPVLQALRLLHLHWLLQSAQALKPVLALALVLVLVPLR